MFRSFAIAAAALAVTAAPSYATSCRDAHGKFIKCATKAPVKATRCKDAKGKFAKCGTPGAMPMGEHMTKTTVVKTSKTTTHH